MQPETRYARSGDVHVAYQAVGGGPLDLVLVPGFVSHVEEWWEEPLCARFFERLASFSRLLLFDKRGTGLSDRVAAVPTLEQRMDDVRAVMEAAGSQRAAVLGISEGGAMSALFAATHPERTAALVLYGTFAAFSSWVPTPQQLEHFLRAIDETWGTGRSLPHFAPSVADDPRFRRWWARHERLGASPGAAMALMRMNSEIDVRPVLPAIRVPTLVLHRTGDVTVNVRAGREQAVLIPGARYVELPGVDHLPFVGDADTILDEIEEFLTGVRPAPASDRVLATVLFVDVVGSTERAARLGDRRWADLLAAFYGLVRRELGRFRGREVRRRRRGPAVDLRRARPRHPLRPRHHGRGRRPGAPGAGRAAHGRGGGGGRRRAGHRGAHRRPRGGPGRGGRGAGLQHRQGPGRRLRHPVRRPGRARPQGRPRRVAAVPRRALICAPHAGSGPPRCAAEAALEAVLLAAGAGPPRRRDRPPRDAGEGQVTVSGKGGTTRAVLLPAGAGRPAPRL